MLTLTENASTIVRDITAQLGAEPTAAQDGVPTINADPGLRITTEAGPEPSFAVTTAQAPEPGDKTVSQDGATIYLDETASVQLDDKVLDARVDQSGNVEFALGMQA